MLARSDPIGGNGSSLAPSKNAILMYFVQQWTPVNQPPPSTP